MVTIKTKSVDNTKDKNIGENVDDYSSRRFNQEFEKW